MISLGTRHSSVEPRPPTRSTLGFRGAIMDSGWDLGSQRAATRASTRATNTDGYLHLVQGLKDALGPSFIDR